MKHTVVMSIIILVVGYYLGVKFPAVGSNLVSSVKSAV